MFCVPQCFLSLKKCDFTFFHTFRLILGVFCPFWVMFHTFRGNLYFNQNLLKTLDDSRSFIKCPTCFHGLWLTRIHETDFVKNLLIAKSRWFYRFSRANSVRFRTDWVSGGETGWKWKLTRCTFILKNPIEKKIEENLFWKFDFRSFLKNLRFFGKSFSKIQQHFEFY